MGTTYSEVRNDVRTFRDPATGRTVRQLTFGGVNVSPYFNNYAWSADGKWIFFVRVEGDQGWVVAAEVETGRLRKLAGPFQSPMAVPHEDELGWATLNAIPGTNAVTFTADGAVWRADIDGTGPVRIAELPSRAAYYCDSGVSGDGKWHTLAAVNLDAEGWKNRGKITWPADAFFDKHLIGSSFFRVALDGTGRVEALFDAPKAFVSHVSVNPVDPDLIMYCHEGGVPFQMGRVFLRHLSETSARPVRDQRSGKVWVTHEIWYPDGKRFAYHGHYKPPTLQSPLRSYAGYYELERELPFEFEIEGPRHRYSHVVPSMDGERLFMDMLPSEPNLPQCLYELVLDRNKGTCRREVACSVASDLSPLPNDQWRSTDPVISPDGKRIVFKAAQKSQLNLFVLEL